MKNPFCYYLRVRYLECDAQKVVFNARYVDYVDLAVTEFIRAVWGSYTDLLSNDIDFQVVSLSIDWAAPARYDDILGITVESHKIGDSSFTLKVAVYNALTRARLASVKVVDVLVDATHLKKMTIPEDMRRRLEAGAPGVTVDHAGFATSCGTGGDQ